MLARVFTMFGWSGPRVSYHAKRWHVHVASAFPLARHYRAVFGYG